MEDGVGYRRCHPYDRYLAEALDPKRVHVEVLLFDEVYFEVGYIQIYGDQVVGQVRVCTVSRCPLVKEMGPSISAFPMPPTIPPVHWARRQPGFIILPVARPPRIALPSHVARLSGSNGTFCQDHAKGVHLGKLHASSGHVPSKRQPRCPSAARGDVAVRQTGGRFAPAPEDSISPLQGLIVGYRRMAKASRKLRVLADSSFTFMQAARAPQYQL